jgi:predicted GNAT superfamily acetyltransferase
MLIEWPIRSARVNKKIAGPGRAARYDPAALPKALERRRGDDEAGAAPFAGPGRPKLNLKEPIVLVEVPRDIKALRGRPDLIAAWQKGLRRIMQSYFGRGYTADHFIHGDRCFYVLHSSARRRPS